MTSNNKRIAKNTMLLYIRMLFTMCVSLYTSRIVLKTLGVEDFGTYSVVGGVVAMLAFLNGALSNSTSRFLTFELGRKDFSKLKRVFSTTLSIHIVLALLIGVLAETIGLWFLYNKIVIPPDRMAAAVWTYHLSVLTILVTITQVPYNASIIANERMNVYAYVTIIEVTLKLAMVYLLVIMPYDKLVTYAVLMFCVSLIVAMIYRIYCIKQFKECHYSPVWDRELVKAISSFSGWSLAGNMAFALVNHGSNIVLNLFFGPAVNAAKAIAVQVNIVVNSFAANFRTAAFPQIVKHHAENRDDKMRELALNTTKFSYFLLLFLELPILFNTKIILSLWLGELPEFVVLFVQLTLLETLISIFDVSFYSVLVAINRIKENAIISPTLGLLILPLAYVLYNMGYEPQYIFYLMLIKSALLSFIVKPILLIKFASHNISDFTRLFKECVLVTIVGVTFSFLGKMYLDEGIIGFIVLGLISSLSIAVSVFYVGIDRLQKDYIKKFAMTKLQMISKKNID